MEWIKEEVSRRLSALVPQPEPANRNADELADFLTGELLP